MEMHALEILSVAKQSSLTPPNRSRCQWNLSLCLCYNSVLKVWAPFHWPWSQCVHPVVNPNKAPNLHFFSESPRDHTSTGCSARTLCFLSCFFFFVWRRGPLVHFFTNWIVAADDSLHIVSLTVCISLSDQNSESNENYPTYLLEHLATFSVGAQYGKFTFIYLHNIRR